MMRLTRDRLVFLCLGGLYDIMARAAQGPVEPTPQVRAVLATLCMLGERDDRAVFDAVWRACRIRPSHTLTDYRASQQRTAELAKLWPRVCRHVGVEPGDALSARLHRLCYGHETEREQMVRIMNENEHRRTLFKRHRRQKQQCTITG